MRRPAWANWSCLPNHNVHVFTQPGSNSDEVFRVTNVWNLPGSRLGVADFMSSDLSNGASNIARDAARLSLSFQPGRRNGKMSGFPLMWGASIEFGSQRGMLFL